MFARPHRAFATFALAGALYCATPSQAAVVFVQQNNAVPQTPQASVSVRFTATQTAGDVNVIVVGWNDSTSTVASVTDSQGNTYQRAVGPTVLTGKLSQSIYYARNIRAAAANGNTVTVQFNRPAAFADIRVLEYRGIDNVNPVDVTAGAKGTSATSSSGAATTTNANDLLFGANITTTFTKSAGAGFVSRVLTPDGDIAEDRSVTSVGSYAATAPLSPSGAWVMQMVAFRAAADAGDVTAPTAPTNLTASSITATSVTLSWGASTDDVGVDHYAVFRNGTAIASVTGLQYVDTVLPSTTYSYTVNAVDAAGNASLPSNAAPVTTPGQGDPGPGTATSVTQYGITFTFDSEKVVGQFANGDYWVIGPVTINSITPDFDTAAGTNGWQVNPDDSFKQSFDRNGPYYQPSLMPGLPYTAQPGASIVKVISLQNPDPQFCDASEFVSKACLRTAAVLTVLGSVPQDNGATLFRPPYFGANKPLFSTADMDANLGILPRLSTSPEFDSKLPTLDRALDNVKRMNIVHIPEVSAFYPIDNVIESQPPPYSPGMSNIMMEAVLRALVVKPGDDETVRRQIILSVIQRGIDNYGARTGGVHWYANGGNNLSMKAPMTLAGLLLNSQTIKDAITNADRNDFAESGNIQLPVRAGVPPLWGQVLQGGEENYWRAVFNHNNANTGNDPYGFIDGGGVPDEAYSLCCVNSALKAQSLVIHLIPGMQTVWHDDAELDYVERFVTRGLWMQPDPCAPVDQGGGPNPDRPGECILDPDLTPGSTFTDFSCQEGKVCGRFPQLHGAMRDWQQWQSLLAEAMWPVFRSRW
jgi:hypothetical protein